MRALFSSPKKIVALLAFLALLGALPLILFIQSQQQITRSNAANTCTATGGSGGTTNSLPGISLTPGNGGSGTSINGICKPGTNGYSLDARDYCTGGFIFISWPVTNTSTYYKLLIDDVQVQNGTRLTFNATNYSISQLHRVTLFAGNAAVGDFNPSTGGSFQIQNSACTSPTPTETPTPIPPTVTPAPPAVLISIDAPSFPIPDGGSATITWSSSRTTNCTATGNAIGWSGTKSLSGSETSGPLSGPNNYTYTLTCTGLGGTISYTATAAVSSPPHTVFDITVFLHGIGQSGDNTNEEAFTLSNKNPLTKTKTLKIEVLESDPNTSTSVKILEKSGIITYQPATGNYTGTIDMGTTLQNKAYTVKLKGDKYFKKSGGNPTVITGTTIQLPPTTLSAGDAFEDNNANINDYNLIYSCYSVDSPPRSCTAAQKYQADLNDDGNVNQYDYNLFLREISNLKGE